jgi:hypothetical protein
MFSPVHSREQRQRGGGKERDDVVILHEADLLGREEEEESTGLAVGEADAGYDRNEAGVCLRRHASEDNGC